MTEVTSEPITKRSLLSEGIFLTIASAYVYCATFAYEYGFCNHFGIPPSLISPNASTLLLAAFTLGITLLPVLHFLPFTMPFLKASVDPNRAAYRLVNVYAWVFVVAGILLIAIYGISLMGFISYLVAVLLLSAFLFLPAILSDRHLPVSERFSNHADIQDRDPFVVTSLFEGWVSFRTIQISFAALVFLFIAYFAGGAEAGKKHQFLALTTEQDVVLLRNYGDVMIFGRLDDSETQLNSFRLMKLGENSELDLISRRIGPFTTAREDMKPNDVDATFPPATNPANEALSQSK